jgi:hypothetical protein
LWLTTSCASKVVGIYNTSASDKNFKTFLVQSPQKNGSLTKENELLDKRLQDIISTSLENKGLTTSSLPDLYVSYMMSVYSTSETTNNNYNSPYYRNNYMYPSSYDYTTHTYRTGVYIIDIKNTRGKLIWQGSKTFKLKSKQSVQATLPEICREIMDAFEVPK